MVDAQLNYFDMAVFGIMALSCIFAFFRGFVKEILSLIAWVGAAFITVRYFADFTEILKPHFAHEKVAAICATALLYFGSLIMFAIFNRMIIKVLKSGTEIGWFDNILGFGFGALRGAFIISLGFFMLSIAISEENRPDWLEKAVTRPYVEKGALMLAQIAPKYMNELSDLQKKAKDRVENSTTEIKSIDSTDINNVSDEVEESGKESAGGFGQFLKNLGKK